MRGIKVGALYLKALREKVAASECAVRARHGHDLGLLAQQVRDALAHVAHHLERAVLVELREQPLHRAPVAPRAHNVLVQVFPCIDSIRK